VTEYYYRRKLGGKDLVPAAGIGALIGLAAFYLVQLLIQRTPLTPSSRLSQSPGKLPASRPRTG
jgi:hypothetical protein